MRYRTILCFVVMHLAALLSAARAADDATPRPALVSFPTFGVQLTPPADYRRLPESGAGQIARWATTDTRDAVTTMVTAEVEPRDGRSLHDYITELAGRMGVVRSEENLTLGGESAARLLAIRGSKTRGFRPIEAVVAIHGNYFYLVSGWSDGVADVRPAVESVRQSWTFKDAVSPADSDTLRDDAFPLFNGLIRIAPQATLRPMPADKPKTQVQLIAHNYTNGKTELCILLETFPPMGRITFQQQVAAFSAAMQRSTGKTFQFAPVGRKSDRVMCQIMQTRARDPKAKEAAFTQIALLDAGKGRLVLATITVTTDDPAARNAYFLQSQGFVERIVRGEP